MRTTAIGIGMTALIAFACASAQAQSWMPPAEKERCPSKWGAGDERGSGNHMKPASVLKAAKLIHESPDFTRTWKAWHTERAAAAAKEPTGSRKRRKKT